MFATYTVGSFVEESLARWSAFAADARVSTRVNVLDSYPFQNSVRVLLDESIGRFSFPTLALTACQDRWPECHSAIRDFLGRHLRARCRHIALSLRSARRGSVAGKSDREPTSRASP